MRIGDQMPTSRGNTPLSKTNTPTYKSPQSSGKHSSGSKQQSRSSPSGHHLQNQQQQQMRPKANIIGSKTAPDRSTYFLIKYDNSFTPRWEDKNQLDSSIYQALIDKYERKQMAIHGVNMHTISNTSNNYNSANLPSNKSKSNNKKSSGKKQRRHGQSSSSDEERDEYTYQTNRMRKIEIENEKRNSIIHPNHLDDESSCFGEPIQLKKKQKKPSAEKKNNENVGFEQQHQNVPEINGVEEESTIINQDKNDENATTKTKKSKMSLQTIQNEISALDQMFFNMGSKPQQKSKSKYEARLAKLMQQDQTSDQVNSTTKTTATPEKIPETPTFSKNSPGNIKQSNNNDQMFASPLRPVSNIESLKIQSNGKTSSNNGKQSVSPNMKQPNDTSFASPAQQESSNSRTMRSTNSSNKMSSSADKFRSLNEKSATSRYTNIASHATSLLYKAEAEAAAAEAKKRQIEQKNAFNSRDVSPLKKSPIQKQYQHMQQQQQRFIEVRPSIYQQRNQGVQQQQQQQSRQAPAPRSLKKVTQKLAAYTLEKMAAQKAASDRITNFYKQKETLLKTFGTGTGNESPTLSPPKNKRQQPWLGGKHYIAQEVPRIVPPEEIIAAAKKEERERYFMQKDFASYLEKTFTSAKRLSQSPTSPMRHHTNAPLTLGTNGLGNSHVHHQQQQQNLQNNSNNLFEVPTPTVSIPNSPKLPSANPIGIPVPESMRMAPVPTTSLTSAFSSMGIQLELMNAQSALKELELLQSQSQVLSQSIMTQSQQVLDSQLSQSGFNPHIQPLKDQLKKNFERMYEIINKRRWVISPVTTAGFNPMLGKKKKFQSTIKKPSFPFPRPHRRTSSQEIQDVDADDENENNVTDYNSDDEDGIKEPKLIKKLRALRKKGMASDRDANEDDEEDVEQEAEVDQKKKEQEEEVEEEEEDDDDKEFQQLKNQKKIEQIHDLLQMSQSFIDSKKQFIEMNSTNRRKFMNSHELLSEEEKEFTNEFSIFNATPKQKALSGMKDDCFEEEDIDYLQEKVISYLQINAQEELLNHPFQDLDNSFLAISTKELAEKELLKGKQKKKNSFFLQREEDSIIDAIDEDDNDSEQEKEIEEQKKDTKEITRETSVSAATNEIGKKSEKLEVSKKSNNLIQEVQNNVYGSSVCSNSNNHNTKDINSSGQNSNPRLSEASAGQEKMVEECCDNNTTDEVQMECEGDSEYVLDVELNNDSRMIEENESQKQPEKQQQQQVEQEQKVHCEENSDTITFANVSEVKKGVCLSQKRTTQEANTEMENATVNKSIEEEKLNTENIPEDMIIDEQKLTEEKQVKEATPVVEAEEVNEIEENSGRQIIERKQSIEQEVDKQQVIEEQTSKLNTVEGEEKEQMVVSEQIEIENNNSMSIVRVEESEKMKECEKSDEIKDSKIILNEDKTENRIHDESLIIETEKETTSQINVTSVSLMNQEVDSSISNISGIVAESRIAVNLDSISVKEIQILDELNTSENKEKQMEKIKETQQVEAVVSNIQNIQAGDNANSTDTIIETKRKYGHFENGDKPKRVVSCKQFESDILVDIEWEIRDDGFTPKRSTINSKIVRENNPLVLLDYYESKIKFTQGSGSASKKKVNTGSSSISC